MSDTWLDDSVNEEAKDALYDHVSNCSFPYTDCKHFMVINEENVRVIPIIH